MSDEQMKAHMRLLATLPVRTIAERQCSAAIPEALIEQRREQVLALRAEGKSVRAIAEELWLAIGTVHNIVYPRESKTGQRRSRGG